MIQINYDTPIYKNTLQLSNQQDFSYTDMNRVHSILTGKKVRCKWPLFEKGNCVYLLIYGKKRALKRNTTNQQHWLLHTEGRLGKKQRHFVNHFVLNFMSYVHIFKNQIKIKLKKYKGTVTQFKEPINTALIKQPMKGLFYFSIQLYQLEANYFTVLQWFLPYIDMNQPWIYMYSPP